MSPLPNPTRDPKHVNDLIQEDAVAHQIDVDRVIAGLSAKAAGTVLEVHRSVEQHIPTRRLLHAERILREAYKRLADEMTASGKSIAAIEMTAVAGRYNLKLGSAVVTAPPEELVAAALRSPTMLGSPTTAWWSEQPVRVIKKFMDIVRPGLLVGRSTQDMVSEWRNVSAFEARAASAQVQTATHSMLNEARMEAFKRNQGVLKGVQAVATLDGRTTPLCQSRDGMAWDFDGRPLNDRTTLAFPGPPPWHWNCRTVLIGVVKSAEEITNGKIKAKLLPGVRASMTGQVSDKLTYEDWFATLSEGQQREIMGEAKWALWKSGKLSFLDMVDQRSGRPLSVEQLAQKVARRT